MIEQLNVQAGLASYEAACVHLGDAYALMTCDVRHVLEKEYSLCEAQASRCAVVVFQKRVEFAACFGVP
jgi:hypothetical protein